MPVEKIVDEILTAAQEFKLTGSDKSKNEPGMYSMMFSTKMAMGERSANDVIEELDKAEAGLNLLKETKN